jgi:hypothetical protein
MDFDHRLLFRMLGLQGAPDLPEEVSERDVARRAQAPPKRCGEACGLLDRCPLQLGIEYHYTELLYMPCIIEFLGYNPLPDAQDCASQLLEDRGG